MPPPDKPPPENWPPSIDEAEAELDDHEDSGDPMTFLDHLEDLRWTVFKSVAAFGIACVLVGLFLVQFSDLLRWPYTFAVGGRDLEMSGLINTSILGVFSVIFYLLIGGGFSLSLPFMLYFFGSFVAPGLNEREMRLLRPACAGAFILFLLGCAFSFFILVPAALRASIIFNELLGFAPLWTAASYYGMMTWMVLGVGIAFQFPLVLLILVFLGILSRAQLVAFRRYSIVLFLCIGAVVTPTTDPITFILLALPMSLLYELAIVGAGRLERKRAEDEAAEDAA
ncbi:MAG: twin-arginine translocase subunit TatC [Oceanipulchritudo sp.]